MRSVSLSKSLAVLVALAVGAGVAAGCGSDSSSSGSGSGAGSATSTKSSNIRLAGVVPNTSDPFFQSQVCAAQDEAKRLGVTLKMYTSTSTDTNALATNFQ